MPLKEHTVAPGSEPLNYWLLLYVKGMAMGAAEVVPGVSGGTIAFITGIYERLLHAIGAFTPALVNVYREKGLRGLWIRVDAVFLLVLVAGMATSVLTFARLISFALANYAIFVWAFFFGLIVASIYLVALEVKYWRLNPVLTMITGAIAGFIMTQIVPLEADAGPVYIFLGGAVAVCAWILPGLSGSFILLLLGLYATVINAINSLNLVLLGSLALGCVLGLVCFSHVLSWMLRRYRDETLGLLIGFMIGALVKIWPWKQTLSYQMGHAGEQIPLVQQAVMPYTFQEITGGDPQIALVVAICVLGLAFVVALERATRD
jgi:putative membrane protein